MLFVKLLTIFIRCAGLLSCSFLAFKRTTWPSLVTLEVTLICMHLFLFAGETDAWRLPFRGVCFNLDWVISDLVVLQCSKCKQKKQCDVLTPALSVTLVPPLCRPCVAKCCADCGSWLVAVLRVDFVETGYLMSVLVSIEASTDKDIAWCTHPYICHVTGVFGRTRVSLLQGKWVLVGDSEDGRLCLNRLVETRLCFNALCGRTFSLGVCDWGTGKAVFRDKIGILSSNQFWVSRKHTTSKNLVRDWEFSNTWKTMFRTKLSLVRKSMILSSARKSACLP